MEPNSALLETIGKQLRALKVGADR